MTGSLPDIARRRVSICYLQQQSPDTSTPAGKATFHWLLVSASTPVLLVQRHRKKLGRPRCNAPRELRKHGVGINEIARKLGIGASYVQ
jgi:hypothetical protein